MKVSCQRLLDSKSENTENNTENFQYHHLYHPKGVMTRRSVRSIMSVIIRNEMWFEKNENKKVIFTKNKKVATLFVVSIDS